MHNHSKEKINTIVLILVSEKIVGALIGTILSVIFVIGFLYLNGVLYNFAFRLLFIGSVIILVILLFKLGIKLINTFWNRVGNRFKGDKSLTRRLIKELSEISLNISFPKWTLMLSLSEFIASLSKWKKEMARPDNKVAHPFTTIILFQTLFLWILYGFGLYSIVEIFPTDLNILLILPISFAGGLSILIKIFPGAVGQEEFVLVSLFSLAGVPIKYGLPISLLHILLKRVLNIFLGLISSVFDYYHDWISDETSRNVL